MSGLEPGGPTPEQAEILRRHSVRVHLALVEPDVASAYLGAAVARLALDADVSPREAVEKLLAGGAFVGPDEWEREARNLRSFTRLTRARFAGVAVQLLARQGNLN